MPRRGETATAQAVMQPADIAPAGSFAAAFPSSADIDSLAGEALKRYARHAGVSPRDVDELTEDRLRQNTKLFVAQHLEHLTED